MSHNIFGEFSAWLTEQDKSAKTVAAYLSDLRQFEKWLANNGIAFNVADIITRDITSWRDQLQAKQKPATVNRKLVSVKQFFAWALEKQLIARDPARSVKLIQFEAEPPRKLSQKEERAFIRAVEKVGVLRDIAIITLMLNTGLRREEVAKLMKRDITINERSGSVTVRKGKGNKYRDVALNLSARKALTEYLENEPHNLEFLFPSIREPDKQLDVRGINYLVEKYAQAAGLKNVTPHTLRHTFAYSVNKAAGLEVVQKLLGHKHINTTTRYTTPTKDDLQNAVDNIDWN